MDAWLHPAQPGSVRSAVTVSASRSEPRKLFFHRADDSRIPRLGKQPERLADLSAARGNR